MRLGPSQIKKKKQKNIYVNFRVKAKKECKNSRSMREIHKTM